jgi:exodeoxyribonuclease VIII
MPAEDYHATWAASASVLRKLRGKTPAHLRKALDTPVKPTWEMILGTLIHHRILEPHRSSPLLAVTPATYVIPEDHKPAKKTDPQPGEVVEWNWRTKYCKGWGKAMEDAGLIIVNESDVTEINMATERVMAVPEARELLECAQTEVSLFWETNCGFPCKARLDILPQLPMLGDLKTCRDASQSGFQRDAWDAGYHVQAAWYLDGWAAVGDREVNQFKFIAYEREIGLVKVHRVSSDVIQAGREEYQGLLEIYMRCVRSGEWPGYRKESCLWELPKWRKESNE